MSKKNANIALGIAALLILMSAASFGSRSLKGTYTPSTNRYTKIIPSSQVDIRREELRLYKKAIGKEIRGVAKVYKIEQLPNGSIEIEMEYVRPYAGSRGAYRHLKLAPYYAIQCAGAGLDHNCLDETDLTDQEYELAKGFMDDLYSAIQYFQTTPDGLDSNVKNFGFLNRNGREELVFMDFGHGYMGFEEETLP